MLWALQLRCKGVLAVGRQGMPQSHCRPSRERFPQGNNSAQAGRVSQTSCYSSALLAETSPARVFYSSARLGSAPGKTVTAGLLAGKDVTLHCRPYSRGLLGRKNPGGRSSSKLNRVPWEWSVLGWPFVVRLWRNSGIGGLVFKPWSWGLVRARCFSLALFTLQVQLLKSEQFTEQWPPVRES